jgi:hypothetical protein
MKENEVTDSTEVSNAEHLLIPFSNSPNFNKILDFAILIKEQKSSFPLSVLTVVPNNEASEANIFRAKQQFEGMKSHAAASEVPVNFIAAIDHNPVGGIVRTSREIMADIILIDWVEKSSIFDLILGEQTSAILKNSEKAVFLCKISKPMVSHARIILFIPPLSEMEIGFSQLIQKASKLASELSIPMLIFCNEKTRVVLKNLISKRKIHSTVKYDHFDQWEDFLVLSKYIDEKDLLILFSSRRGAISYFPLIENIPTKIKKYYPNHNFIICFPKQNGHQDISQMGNVDLSSPGVIHTGIETIQKIGKGIGGLIKNKL